MIEYKLVPPGAGKLLIAEPFMRDGNFRRSVVLLTAHGNEGAVGFVLNHPSEFKISEVAPDFSNEYGFDPPVYVGGPVQPDTLHFIHRLGDVITGAVKIGQQTWWGGDPDQLIEQISLNKVNEGQIRFFMGYSGWGFAQLELEITEKTWIVADNDEDLLFASESDNEFWRKTVMKLGGKYRELANYPEDVHWN